MLGALHGASGIPAAMRAAVQDSGSATAGRKRPEELWGRRLEPLAQQLFAEAVRDAEAEALRQPGIQAPLQ